MANEVQVGANLTISKNGVLIAGSGSTSITQVGGQNIGNTQTVGTTQETLLVGDVSTIGYLFVKNLDATNFVEIDSSNAFDKFPQKLLPGEFVLLKPQTATLYVKANTASVDIWIVAVEL